MQFISSAVVEEAPGRDCATLGSDPVIFGVDIARFGDDHSTLAIRCGRDAKTRPWKRWHGADTMTVAGDIDLEAQLYKPDAIFVRSEESRVGKECVSTGRSRWPPHHEKIKHNQHNTLQRQSKT